MNNLFSFFEKLNCFEPPWIYGDDSFPREGIRLSHIHDFIYLFGGRSAFEGLTTSDVCDNVIKPATGHVQVSYCEMLMDQQEDEEWLTVGPAQVFISHAWAYKFLDVVDALFFHFKNKQNIFIWFDLFSVNQHQTQYRDFQWWTTTFQQSISEIGYTVMVLSPWQNPLPLTRAWCLWELYSAVETKSRFEIALSENEQKHFFGDLATDVDGCLLKMFSCINVEKSQAFKQEDRDRIFQAIRNTIGFSQLNAIVFNRLREWIVAVTEVEVSKCTSSLEEEYSANFVRTLGLKIALAHIYDHLLGASDVSERILTECITEYRAKSDITHRDALTAMNNLAALKQKRGDFKSAVELLDECLGISQIVLGKDDVNTLATMTNLASVHQDLKNFEKAESLYLEALDGYEHRCGIENRDTLTAMSNIGMLYLDIGKLDEAQRLLENCLLHLRRIFGSQDPSTLTVMNNLAMIYKERPERLEEAEFLLRQCLEGETIQFGLEHPTTRTTAANLAKIRGLRSGHR